MLKYFFLVLAFTLTVFGSQQTDMTAKGNILYKKGDFEGAITAYESVLKSGFESSALYYNLGNAYYREGKIGYALLNFEKAKKLSPNDEDINHNIALLNTRITDRIESMPRFFLFQWWDNIVYLFSINGWTYMVYFIYFIFLVVICIYFVAKQPNLQKYSFFGGIIVFCTLVFSIIILFINVNRELNSKSGIITSNYVNVKSSPDEKSNDAFVIHEGLKIRLEDKVDNWYKIKLRDGKLGWISSGNFKII